MLISALVVVGAVIGLLVFNYYRPPEYSEILILVENLMNSQESISIDYAIEYQLINGTKTTEMEGEAYFSLDEESVSWNNNLASIEGTFYDLKPYDLLDFMKLSVVDAVEDYNSNITCYLLNAFFADDIEEDILMEYYQYVRIMACFDKETGYPSQYTMLVIGDDQGVLVSYNSLRRVTREPKPFNESQVQIPSDVPSDFVGNESLSEEALKAYEDYVKEHS